MVTKARARWVQKRLNWYRLHFQVEGAWGELDVDGDLGSLSDAAVEQSKRCMGYVAKYADAAVADSYVHHLYRPLSSFSGKQQKRGRAYRDAIRKRSTGSLQARALENARKLLGVHEEGGNNIGRIVSKIIRANGGTPGEPWCFAAGTLVNTPAGLRPIESIGDGDEVLTADGRPAPVLTMSRVRPTVKLRALGVDGTMTTAEHPYYARRNAGRPGRPAFGEPEWVPAGDLRRGDMIRLPSLAGGDAPFSPASAYVFGRWLADGWTVVKTQRETQEHRAAFVCCAHGEADGLRDRLVEDDVLGAEREYPTVTQFALPVRALPFWQAGGSAQTKRVPGAVLTWNREARAALLRGYLDGDGCRVGRHEVANTVSRELAYGIAQVARSLGQVAYVYGYERPTDATIQGRRVRQTGMRYEVKIGADAPQAITDEAGAWVPVREVTLQGEAEVFNLTVAGEPTFIADGAAVHNCGDFVAYVYRLAGSTCVQRGWAAAWSLGRLFGMGSVSAGKVRPGDIVVYSFGTGHTGIFVRWVVEGQSFLAIEGNTGRVGSVNVSDSSSGRDGVYEKQRSVGLVLRFARVYR